MSLLDSFSLDSLSSISTDDLIVGTLLTTLSFIASIVVGSTSLGDGVFLQVTWGIVQGLIPMITANSALGSDGMRVITIFMYIRINVLPFYLLHLLWKGKKSTTSAPPKTQNEIEEKQSSSDDNAAAATTVSVSVDTATTAGATAVVAVAAPPPPPPPPPTTPKPSSSAAPAATENIFSYRLFFIQVIPSILWAVLGIMMLKRMKSDDIAFYLGVICISFSFLYMALKMWKVSPRRKSMPLWLQHFLSPQFLVEGTKDQMTTKATFFVLLATNLSGLMVTLAGIGGPPMMIVILLYEMPTNITRVTFPVASVVSSIFRTAYAVHAGLITFELWPFYLPATIAGFIGIKIGVGIGNVLSPSMYSATIFCLLILAGTVMLTKNPYVTVTALLVSSAGLLLKQFWWDKKKNYEANNDDNNNISAVSASPKTLVAPEEGVFPSSSSSSTPSSSSSSTDSDCHAATTPSVAYRTEDLNRHSRYCEAEVMVEMAMA